MGVRDLSRRLRASVAELDAQRLQGRFRGLDVSPISECPLRTPARIGGEVIRVRMAPRAGVPTVEIVVSDGTGDAAALFTGRRTIAGLEHGRAVIFEGVARLERGRPTMVNPAYTLLPS
jgi:hypothetical protein